MKKILVPLDFTVASKNAFNYAIELAKLLKTELVLLNVVAPIAYDGIYATEVIDFRQDRSTTYALEELKKLAIHYPNIDDKALIEHNIQIQYKVKEGLCVPMILQTAKEIKADLILLGAKDRYPLTNFLFGSVSAELITSTTLPVLCIPENYTFQPIRQIAFATELEGEDYQIALQLRTLAKELKATVCPFFINQLPSDTSKEKEEEWQTSSLPYTDEKAAKVTVVRETSVTKGIEDYLNLHPSQILAMYTYQRPFIQQLFHISTTQQMVANANIPLLVYRK